MSQFNYTLVRQLTARELFADQDLLEQLRAFHSRTKKTSGWTLPATIAAAAGTRLSELPRLRLARRTKLLNSTSKGMVAVF